MNQPDIDPKYHLKRYCFAVARSSDLDTRGSLEVDDKKCIKMFELVLI